jgi:hypothetical protein
LIEQYFRYSHDEKMFTGDKHCRKVTTGRKARWPQEEVDMMKSGGKYCLAVPQ